MAVENQTYSIFANNHHILEWDEILGDNGLIIDLTGRLLKFSMTSIGANGVPAYATPILDFRSDAPSPKITMPNPALGSPHVRVVIDPADTAALVTNKEKVFYGELEWFEASGANAVVLATMLITIKPNVTNA